MLDATEVAEVERAVRRVAEEQILPRFGRLTAADIAFKSSETDFVTVADRAAEEELAKHLTALVPGSIMVGEEAVAGDPALLGAIDGDAPVWIVDPIDGTHNFVSGSPRFTTLVALAHRGRLLASWTYAPVMDLMAVATAGGGAYVDGRRVRVRPVEPTLRHLDVCVSPPIWWKPAHRDGFHRLSRHGVALSFFDTSGLEYIQLASGRRTAMVLTWELPWDHAAGLLLHAEAGGVAMAADGSPFRIGGGNPMPFLVAPDAETARLVLAALNPGDAA
ncbi:inositol monophosphatase family protein [Catellatospora chokoriensis]|uniref:Inositol monophosphatase n=1 Tax=Catellatospora chokoriensis TaxID=310353 RepID=A0A8J3NRZ4_9ACTN|nr:inositol monophosphatase [Catellatospora chokoriensis]GIF89938.1 inositol monophosphatase [Catellatospora chokoriensis]